MPENHPDCAHPAWCAVTGDGDPEAAPTFDRAAEWQRQRRAAIRALANDPSYDPRSRWRVPDPVHRSGRGQSLVEFALIFPVFLFAALGFAEAGVLLSTEAHQARATHTVASWAAQHPGEDWQPVADDELPGCDVEVAESSDIITASATCEYAPRLTSNMWQGLPISTEESAAMAEPAVPPAPTPSPTPCPLPCLP